MLDPLTFEELRVVDVERCDSAVWGPGNKLNDWSPTDWACALAGEVGEACNLIKKARRDGRGYDLGRVLNIAKELADVIIYTDLLAARLEIDLGAAVRAKFNEVSQRVGSPVRLPSLADDVEELLKQARERTRELREAALAGEDVGDLPSTVLRASKETP
jgi:NTP pyrophosphatase (non-canonical NTP hydrolase)